MHKVLLEYLPPVVFVVVYFLSDMFTATMAIIATVTVGWVWSRLQRRRLSRIQEYSVWALWVLGGLTLVLRNPWFIVWKPTVVYMCLALTFLINAKISDKLLTRHAFERFYRLDDAGWRHLQRAWSVLFVFLGTMNVLVAYNFSEPTWVQYKLFGNVSVLTAFVLLQTWVLRRNLIGFART